MYIFGMREKHKSYDHKKIEKRWQKEWEKKGVYKAKDFSKKQKFYALVEFPYPSGDGLHVGHPRPYIGLDVVARKRRMEGFNVLYPMGFDAFGLPTENYAIKTGKQPEEVTKKNIENFRRQIKLLGTSFDWSREVNTTDPKYYKWTQWLFLQFLKHDLAYKDKISINWCPKCKIGLANEEVVGGNCERCGAPVEKREKEQWMLRITKYAERLHKDLDDVDYLEKIKIQQRNWIGKSEGTELEFELRIKNHESRGEKIKVFTTRADTLFGVTYLVVAPEYEKMEDWKKSGAIKNWNEVEKYIRKARNRTEIERTAAGSEQTKTGIKLEGISVINPANGEEVPVFVADYVLGNYGTGAVMAVPAHDDRDFAFAKKYNLPIKQVIVPKFIDPVNVPCEGKKVVGRRTAHSIIRNPKNDKILMLQWKGDVWGDHPPKTFVIGGIEKGESPEEAARREIREETGYTKLKFVGQSNIEVHTEYFAAHKDENRYSKITAVYFELETDEKEEVDSKETQKHDPVWIDHEKVASFVNVVDGPFVWNQYKKGDGSFTEDGVLINSDGFDSMSSEEAREKITEKFGKKVVKYKLRDWVFSRQRYWGEPIPVVHCPKCGIVPLSEKDLPLKLPKVKNYQPTDTGDSPLASIEKWVNTKCPKCGGKAKRETDTMPNWAGSSWYFLRYIDPKNSKKFADLKKLKYWLGSPKRGVGGGVDWYNGGMEHTTLHLLYSRFWNKFFYDIGLVPVSEPYKKRTSHGFILASDGGKMSKSRGNVINPDDVVELHGADAFRLYEMFMGPFDQMISWSDNNIIGVRRFVERFWKLGTKIDITPRPPFKVRGGVKQSKTEELENKKFQALLHKTIKKVGEDIELMSFNTAVSDMMILANEMESVFARGSGVTKKDFEKFLMIMSPFAPHITEEIWHMLGNKSLLVEQKWPKYDESKIKEENVIIVVQINGKVRAQLESESNAAEDKVKNKALIMPEVKKWLNGNEIKRVIFVPNKIINFVI